MNGVIYVGKIADVVLNTGQRLGVFQQALHFSLSAAISKFQIVQHGIVLLGEPLIGVGDPLHVGAKFIGIVRHIRQSHIGNVCRFSGIPAQTLQQGCSKTCHLLHVAVGRHTGRFICLLGIGNHSSSGVLKKRFDAAQTLLQLRTRRNAAGQRFPDGGCGNHVFDFADQIRAENASGAFSAGGHFPIDNTGQAILHASRRRHDLNIRFR